MFEEDKKPLVSYTLPKVEMHVHISLALAEEIFLKRIKKKRTTLNADFLTERTHRYYPNLARHHETYESMRYLTNTMQELAQVTQMYLERIAHDGAIYAELSNTFRNESDFDAQIEAIEEGIRVAHENTGIIARIVVTNLRADGIKAEGRGPEHAEAAAKYIARRKFKHVSGFGLVGVENLDALRGYQRALEIAWHEAGLGIAPHISEQHLKNAVDFVAMLDDMKLNVSEKDARRVRAGHAPLIHASDRLMDEFSRHAICLETCFSANKRINLPDETRALKKGDDVGGYILDRPVAHYFNEVIHHPARDLADAGIQLCFGSDNPLLMNTNIGKEYSLAVKAYYKSKTGYDGTDPAVINWLLDRTMDAIRNANVDWDTRNGLMELTETYRADINAGKTPMQTVLGYQQPFNRF